MVSASYGFSAFFAADELPIRVVRICAARTIEEIAPCLDPVVLRENVKPILQRMKVNLLVYVLAFPFNN